MCSKLHQVEVNEALWIHFKTTMSQDQVIKTATVRDPCCQLKLYRWTFSHKSATKPPQTNKHTVDGQFLGPWSFGAPGQLWGFLSDSDLTNLWESGPQEKVSSQLLQSHFFPLYSVVNIKLMIHTDRQSPLLQFAWGHCLRNVAVNGFAHCDKDIKSTDVEKHKDDSEEEEVDSLQLVSLFALFLLLLLFLTHWCFSAHCTKTSKCIIGVCRGCKL